MNKGTFWRLCSLFCLLTVLVLACAPSGIPTSTPTSPPTTTAAPVSFAGKTITVVVSSSPGGGTDLMGRVYSTFLPRYLPGKPTMIVRNMPGGANTIGVNYVYKAAPDGLTVLTSGGSTALNQLVGMKAVNYDALTMPACIADAGGGMFYIKKGIIDKPEDILKAKDLIFSGPTSIAHLFISAKEFLDIPMKKAVLAYTGTGDSRRAFLSGETNMSYDPSISYNESVAQYVVRGEVMPLFQTGLIDDKGNLVKDPGLPADVPTAKELYEKLYGKSPSGMAWEAYKGLITATRSYSDLLFLPPKTPDNITKVYWAASEAMLKDPEFIKYIEPLVGKNARFVAGEACDKGFKLNLSAAIKPEIRDWLRTALTKYGVAIE